MCMGLGPESAGQRGQGLKLDKRGFLNVRALIYNREFNTLSRTPEDGANTTTNTKTRMAFENLSQKTDRVK